MNNEDLPQQPQAQTKPNFLGRLFYSVLNEMKLTVGSWGQLVNEYINCRAIGATMQDRAMIRGNLTREFSRPELSDKLFLKGLKLLQVKSAEIELKIEHADGRITIHRTQLPVGEQTTEVA